jgi:hypothetical protein
MKFSSIFGSAVVLSCVLGLPVAKSQAAQIMVAQCPIGGTCVSTGPTPWSDTLTLAQLTSLGLDTAVPLIAAQTDPEEIRLGVTTADFTVSGGPDVIDTLPEFSGADRPAPPFDTDTVGTFFIPADATGLHISGTFGNTANDTTAPTNVCLGPGPCGGSATPSVPEASTWAMMLLGFAGLGLAGYRHGRKGRSASSIV